MLSVESVNEVCLMSGRVVECNCFSYTRFSFISNKSAIHFQSASFPMLGKHKYVDFSSCL